jgi:hypothetical protein
VWGRLLGVSANRVASDELFLVQSRSEGVPWASTKDWSVIRIDSVGESGNLARDVNEVAAGARAACRSFLDISQKLFTNLQAVHMRS